MADLSEKNMLVEAGRLLNLGEPFVMARIVRLVGSAPRTVGAGCIVRRDGALLGTIGGGLLEHKVIERAKEVLSEGVSTLFRFRLTGKDLETSDMLCGGIADVYLEPLSPENSDAVEVYTQAAQLVKEDLRGTLVTLVAEGLGGLARDNRVLIHQGSVLAGGLKGLPNDFSDLTRKRKARLNLLEDEGEEVFVETVAPDPDLFLFGAGHVSRAVAHVAKMVGFRVTVIDDRAEFANRERFADADKILVAPFDGIMARLALTRNSYLVIVTRGHAHDYNVLRDALTTQTAYIGMIGSRTKRRTVYDRLLEEGAEWEALSAVHAPIGLEIGAGTPEEIAVSIVAELIKVRSSG